MEVFFVYGLVLVFFVALLCIIFILIKEPAKDPGTTPSTHASSTSATKATSLNPVNIASYGLLAAIFALLFIVSIASQRGNNQ